MTTIYLNHNPNESQPHFRGGKRNSTSLYNPFCQLSERCSNFFCWKPKRRKFQRWYWQPQFECFQIFLVVSEAQLPLDLERKIGLQPSSTFLTKEIWAKKEALTPIGIEYEYWAGKVDFSPKKENRKWKKKSRTQANSSFLAFDWFKRSEWNESLSKVSLVSVLIKIILFSFFCLGMDPVWVEDAG